MCTSKLSATALRENLSKQGFREDSGSRFVVEGKDKKTENELITLKEKGWLAIQKRDGRYIKFFVLVEEKGLSECWKRCVIYLDSHKVETFLRNLFPEPVAVAV
ncbi:MAG: hypothetical protein LBO09_04410 [Candidatus Peribacteria bacterium]|jgi:hypothetical protein|nr:hypothetical protein [Candidatus Peribacteria bacterium]